MASHHSNNSIRLKVAPRDNHAYESAKLQQETSQANIITKNICVARYRHDWGVRIGRQKWRVIVTEMVSDKGPRLKRLVISDKQHLPPPSPLPPPPPTDKLVEFHLPIQYVQSHKPHSAAVTKRSKTFWLLSAAKDQICLWPCWMLCIIGTVWVSSKLY